ncbi:MAG: thrombospondin type 3 repeat-containing protein [Deltaproteobacteria bacterium]|nr:thrombospondin type 3 repeat-containing protein [Deltaproteobacteria bacterium]MDQ3296062.1 thrombospondin type 3 repeat-containing protein [Myxococcota bacterium]
MRSLVLILLAGCNPVFGLDPTRAVELPDAGDPRIDEDLDGVLNEVDNCPGIANPEQVDLSETTYGLPADGVGDACDPNDDLVDTVVTRYYFNAPDDATHFTPSAPFTFVDGHVDIAKTAELSYLDHLDMPDVTRGRLTVEAGFELVDKAVGTRIGVYVDGRELHYTLVDLRPDTYLTTYNKYPPPTLCLETNRSGCDEEILPTLPDRIVIQMRSGTGAPKTNDIKGILAGTGVDAKFDSTGQIANKFGMISSANARLLHVIVYISQ